VTESLPGAASVGGDEPVRLFCALQLPDETVEAVAAWQQEHLHGVRIVPAENLHVTLVFIGSRPAADVASIAAELRAAAHAARPFSFELRGYRETPRVGMLVLTEGDVSPGAALVADLERRLNGLGLELRPQHRPWRPHITVTRFRERAGLRPPAPNIRSIHVVRSALYRSSLGRGSAASSGARYDALETAALGGR
jgi:2'-5' RNA ligase